jgi:hypothetical protein
VRPTVTYIKQGSYSYGGDVPPEVQNHEIMVKLSFRVMARGSSDAVNQVSDWVRWAVVMIGDDSPTAIKRKLLNEDPREAK